MNSSRATVPKWPEVVDQGWQAKEKDGRQTEQQVLQQQLATPGASGSSERPPSPTLTGSQVTSSRGFDPRDRIDGRRDRDHDGRQQESSKEKDQGNVAVLPIHRYGRGEQDECDRPDGNLVKEGCGTSAPSRGARRPGKHRRVRLLARSRERFHGCPRLQARPVNRNGSLCRKADAMGPRRGGPPNSPVPLLREYAPCGRPRRSGSRPGNLLRLRVWQVRPGPKVVEPRVDRPVPVRPGSTRTTPPSLTATSRVAPWWTPP